MSEATSDLAYKAGLKALEMGGMKAEDLDLLIVGTSTGDYQIPATAPIVQNKLGCRKIPAFDLNSVCTSFSYSFMNAYSLIASGFYKNALIIGADTYSRILNWKDRNTCILFGDGAGAMLISRDQKKKGILSHIFGADGSGAELIRIPVGGSKFPGQDTSRYLNEDLFFQMEGKKVYEFTIMVIPEVAENLVKNAGLKSTDVDWIVLHQANLRIIDMVSKRLELPSEKFIVNISRVGNTSSGSIPIALDEAVRSGKIKEGDKVMFIGFGGGLSWGGVIIEW
jgi:3-oxoacyl-[acyl-carrier-protein] synthase-3